LDSTSFESCGYNARQEVLDRLQLATLPAGVNPGLGPDYSPTGQIMFYTLHSASPKYDVMELKTLNEWYVVNQLKTVPNVVDEQGFVVPSSRKPMRRMRSCNETHPGSFLQLRSCTLKTGDFDTWVCFQRKAPDTTKDFGARPRRKSGLFLSREQNPVSKKEAGRNCGQTDRGCPGVVGQVDTECLEVPASRRSALGLEQNRTRLAQRGAKRTGYGTLYGRPRKCGHTTTGECLKRW
jgi:hypothetical protein